MSFVLQRIKFHKDMPTRRLLVQLHGLFKLFGASVWWTFSRNTFMRTNWRIYEQNSCCGHQICLPNESFQRIQFDIWIEKWVNSPATKMIWNVQAIWTFDLIIDAGNQIETNRMSSNATIQSDIFQSPFFPNFYPRDLSMEHIFTCDDGLNQTDCTLEVVFSDFQISFSSLIEVSGVDWYFCWLKLPRRHFPSHADFRSQRSAAGRIHWSSLSAANHLFDRSVVGSSFLGQWRHWIRISRTATLFNVRRSQSNRRAVYTLRRFRWIVRRRHNNDEHGRK